MDEELVGEKIDRLNSVISQLMTDIEENNNPRVSMISELQQSFFEYSVVNEGEGVEEMNIPQSVLDKFQESLTEIDRLGMQVEDLLAGRMRRTECFFNILLNHSQISEIHEKLGEALKSSEKSVILKIVNGKIEGLGVEMHIRQWLQRQVQGILAGFIFGVDPFFNFRGEGRGVGAGAQQ